MNDTPVFEPVFEIRHDVPLPGPKYPFANMLVGDSFVVPLNGAAKLLVQSRVTNAICYHTRDTDTKFTTRQVEGGICTWRVE